MSRPGKGPRLYAKPAIRNAAGEVTKAPIWIIRDGTKRISTGIRAGDSKQPPEEAVEALGRYIVESRTSPRERDRYADQVLVADVIAIYLTDKASKQARPDEVAGRAKRLLEWWGTKTLGDVTGPTCRQYIAHRGTDGAARRELEDLRSAIKHHHKEGLCRELVEVTLPDKGQARDRWLTRDEAAKLIRHAWTFRETQKGHLTGRRSRRHIARFILVGLYTGTRAGAICEAAFGPTTGRAWINLETGVFYRRPSGQRESNKRKPPVKLSSRLLGHMRRWARNGQTSAVEFNGEAVASISKAFRSCVVDTKLSDDVTPHTLRHTAATWLMQAGVDLAAAASVLGMTVETLERVYWHHHPDYQVGATEALSQKPGRAGGQKEGRNSVNGREQTRTDENKVVAFARVS